MIRSEIKAAEPMSVLSTNPLLGVAGVLLGTMIAACTGRLLSVGLADQMCLISNF
jgi:MFS transporter, DHA2 family, multidrug resistance protein